MDSPLQAIELARRGDVAGARQLLDRLAAANPGSIDVWLTRAALARGLRDVEGELAALVSALEYEPRNLRVLLARGDLERRRGDDRVATRFFNTALAVASANPPPPELHPALNQAQQFLVAARDRYTDTVSGALADAAIDTSAMPRVAKAVELLTGRSQLYLQQPSMFYFPELAQRPFFERDEFDWVPAIEAATAAIRDELLGLLSGDEAFAPYVRSDPNAPPSTSQLLDDPSWGAFHLFDKGQPHPVNAVRCPATLAALGAAPMPAIGTRSPMALFSRLRPGTHIAPHHGVFNTRLICHLPLIVPPGCAIRVGAETREWREGELLIFDDSFEHEAWNRGGSDRVILLFEVWRPDIALAERDAITTLLGAVERHGMLDGVVD